MNERIKELAEQAGLKSQTMLDDSSRDIECFVTQYNGSIPSISNWGKFAELIVRECAELSVNSQYANTKSEYYEGFNEALVYAGNKIRKHFGVEE